MRKLFVLLTAFLLLSQGLFALNPIAVVTNSGSNSVSFIDTQTVSSVHADITMGSDLRGVATSPDGSKFYVVSQGTNEVLIWQTSDYTQIGTVSTGNGATDIAISPNGSFGAVTNSTDNTITLFNAATPPFSVLAPSLSTLPGTAPAGLAFTKDSAGFYVANVNGFVVGFNTTAPYAQFISFTAPPTTPVAVATISGGRFFVVDSNNAILKVDGFAPPNNLLGQADTGLNPFGIAITPDEDRGFVTNAANGTVSVFSANSFSSLGTVSVGLSPFGIAITPNGDRVCVANRGSDSLSIFSSIPPLFSSFGSTNVGVSPLGVAIFFTPTPVPPPPFNVAGEQIAQPSLHNHLTWESPGGPSILSFRIYRGTDPSSLSLLAEVSAAATTYDDFDIVSGITYFYYLTSVTIDGESPPSTTIVVLPQLAPPTGISGRQIANRYLKQTDLVNELTWSNSGISSSTVAFNIYRDSLFLAQVPASATTYRDHNRQSGVHYSYFLTSVASSGAEGPVSETVIIP